jgi:hypothetical protein
VLTPKIAGELDLPPIRYPYFNPDSRRYEVAATNPARVKIGPGTLASADTARTEMLLKLRTEYRGPVRAPLHEHPVFWAFLALAPVPALTYRSRNRAKTTVKRGPSAAARLASLARETNAIHEASNVRRAFTGALAERLALDPESFTRAGGLARALRRRGVSSDVAMRGEHFLRELDEAAFAAHGALARDAAVRAAKLYEEVDAEALPRTSFGLPALCVAGLLAIGVAGTVHAFNATAAREAFDKGVDAYQRHDFVAAREAFIAAATAEPRSPDAWADLGTASWAVADTARSVAAWQRALRLEPLAPDLRTRVELAHSLTWRSAGFVPAFPISWLFDFAALIWLGAWGVAAYRAAHRIPFGGRSMNVAISSAVLVAVAAFGLADRLSGRRLGVMRDTASLRADPELGGERGATAIIGEVVRVTGRHGAWSRVVLDDGREGWLESAMLVSLDATNSAEMGGD